jgi:hypothetical protein
MFAPHFVKNNLSTASPRARLTIQITGAVPVILNMEQGR